MGYAAVLKCNDYDSTVSTCHLQKAEFCTYPSNFTNAFLQLLFKNHWVLQSVCECLLCKFNSNPPSMLQHLLRNNKNWHLQAKYTAFLIRAFCTSQWFSDIPISAPSEAPPNLSGHAVNSTTIALMWDAIALENQNGILRHYLVSVLELETGETDVYTAGATQLNISGLHPYYTYTCMVAAVTIRIGPFSQSVSIITPQDGDLYFFMDVTHFY